MDKESFIFGGYFSFTANISYLMEVCDLCFRACIAFLNLGLPPSQNSESYMQSEPILNGQPLQALTLKVQHLLREQRRLEFSETQGQP